MGSVDYVAGLGTDTIRGVGDAPPYNYAITGLPNPSSAVLSQAGMDAFLPIPSSLSQSRTAAFSWGPSINHFSKSVAADSIVTASTPSDSEGI